ncbi:hypothetical protein [Desulfofundulus thermosubterraneus]|nr:hypothetical protein [Desulfofundulus thermosubterraneus]
MPAPMAALGTTTVSQRRASGQASASAPSAALKVKIAPQTAVIRALVR